MVSGSLTDDSSMDGVYRGCSNSVNASEVVHFVNFAISAMSNLHTYTSNQSLIA